MVDSNYSKDRDNGRERPEDDPLMELSRIIGIDEPAVADTKQDDRQSDLALDLERELFGTYDEGDGAQARERQPIDDIPDLDSVAEADDVFDFALGDEFAAAFEEELASADADDAAEHAEAPVEAEVAAAPEEAAIAPEDAPTERPEPVEAAVETPAEPVALHETADIAPAVDGPAVPEAPDLSASLSLEDELSAILGVDDAPAASAPQPAPAPQPAAVASGMPAWHGRSFDRTTSFGVAPQPAAEAPAADDETDAAVETGVAVAEPEEAVGDDPFADIHALRPAPEAPTLEEDAAPSIEAADVPVADEAFDDPLDEMDLAQFAVEEPVTAETDVGAEPEASVDEDAVLADAGDDVPARADHFASEPAPAEPAEDFGQEDPFDEFAASPETAAEEPSVAAPFVSEPQFDDLAEIGELDFSLDDEVSLEDAASVDPAADETPDVSRTHYASDVSPAPSVETTQVPEHSIEATAPLELPEVDFGDEPQARAAPLDDLEDEFAEVFATLDVDEPATKEPVADDLTQGAEDEFYARAYHHAEPEHETAHPVVEDVAEAASEPAGSAVHYHDYALGITGGQAQAEAREPYAEDDLDIAFADDIGSGPRHNRGIVIAAVVGAVAILGGLGVFALSRGGGSADKTPVIVKADTKPVKVKPGDPGGMSVPNQDKAVYARADGKPQQAPDQKTLVNDTEKPVALPPAAEPKKSEARINPAATDNNAGAPTDETVLAMKPRRVRTVIVKPDGTIVEPEPAPTASNAQPSDATGTGNADTGNETAPAVASLPQTKPVEAQTLQPVSVPEAPNSASGANTANAATDTQPADTMQPSAAAAQPAPQTGESEASTTMPVLPKAADAPIPMAPPVVPSRPANQPMTVIGSTGGADAASQQVASAAGYAVQIASQPTAEAAQQSYATLARRFSKVLTGRGVDIQRADIPNKGTYYRVRIPAASKQEALSICRDYKAAGGSCYVTH